MAPSAQLASGRMALSEPKSSRRSPHCTSVRSPAGRLGRAERLDPATYGTHSHRLTKVVILHKRTGNLRTCQFLPGHTRLESTVSRAEALNQGPCPARAREAEDAH